MSDDIILQAKGIRKSYASANKKNNEILKGIDLDIYNGEFISIMGQSGSGKSTLLYCISGMEQISSGNIRYHGKELEKLSDDEISRERLLYMGFVFQNSCLLKDFTIKENIMLPGIKAGQCSRNEVAQNAEELMKRVKIEQIADNEITKVSGGQLQRAAICRALINQPAILFADEPTGALNSQSTLEIMDIFNQVNDRGTTIVMVTHDVKVAARATRVIYLSDGTLEQEFHFNPWKNKEESSAREAELMHWLQKNGF